LHAFPAKMEQRPSNSSHKPLGLALSFLCFSDNLDNTIPLPQPLRVTGSWDDGHADATRPSSDASLTLFFFSKKYSWVPHPFVAPSVAWKFTIPGTSAVFPSISPCGHTNFHNVE
ncbi:mCG1042681, partial [Mus musculus]